MLCEQVMTKPVETVVATESVREAAARMRRSDTGFLPVCDAKTRKPIGTLTDRDIALRLVADGKPLNTPVRDVMTKNATCCQSDDDVARAHELMERHKISRMIVVGEDKKVAGVISLADLSDFPETAETLAEIKRG